MMKTVRVRQQTQPKTIWQVDCLTSGARDNPSSNQLGHAWAMKHARLHPGHKVTADYETSTIYVGEVVN